MTHIYHRRHFLLLGLVLALAGLARFWAAPLSAGPDVAQFWAFAKVFQSYGLDFYRYADATLDIFPFKAWAFVYPPLWLLTLRVALLAAPNSWATDAFIDPSWRLAMKTPIIFADLAIGVLIYWAVPGSRLRKLAFASIWLFHPTAWYESAVFGQFDAMAAAFLLASIIMFQRRKDWLAFLLAGLALLTKQHTFMPIAVMLALSMRRADKRTFFKNLAFFLGPAVILSIPFVATGNIVPYARSVFLPAQAADYQFPLCYAFGGSGALLTYLHNLFGWETLDLLRASVPLLAVVLVVVITLSYRKSLDPMQGALVSFLAFVALFYRINYQYLVIYIPLAILVAAKTRWASEKAIAMSLAMLPAVWLWLGDVSGWFNSFQPASPGVTHVLTLVGLTNQVPDYVYVSFAMVLGALSIAYIVFAFLRWHRAGRQQISSVAP